MNKTAVIALAIVLGVLGTLPFVARYNAVKAKENNVIVLSKSNTLVLNEPIVGESVGALIEKAKDMDSAPGYLGGLYSNSNKPIYLFLFTPGGEIQSGLELIESLKGLNRPVDTVTMFAASMGFQLVQNLRNRYILQSGILMSHHAFGGAEGELGGQGTAQLQSRIGLWERRLKEMDEQTVARSNGKQTLASYQKAYDHELWVTGAEGVAQGYADKVVTVKCDDSLSGYTSFQTTFMGLDVSYDLSNCPLNTAPVHVRISMPTNKGKMSSGEFQKQNGDYGANCLQRAVIDNTVLCALDTTLTTEKLFEVKSKFIGNVLDIRNRVVPMNYR